MTKHFGDVVYLTVQKTGCSFCSRVLDTVLRPEFRKNSYHKTNQTLLPNKTYIINVRNPWDYYVSLFTYNNKTNGPLIRRLVSRVGEQVTTDFECFVENLLRLKIHNPVDNKCWLTSHPQLGLLSYRIMAYLDQKSTIDIVQSTDFQVITDHFNYLTTRDNVLFLRQENLFRQLYDTLLQIEPSIQHCFVDGWKQKIETFAKYENFRDVANADTFMKIRQTNKDYKDFHTPKTRQLIETHESLIIDRFNYQY